MRILVADDEKIKRVTLAQDLETQGHEVVTAADGAEALEKLLAGHFDVVVTDLKMPKLDGIELLKRIKHDARHRRRSDHHDGLRQHPAGGRGRKTGGLRLPHQAFPQRRRLPALARIEAARRGTTRSSPEPLETTIGNIDHAVVGQSPAMRRVRRLIEICTRSDANVLLCGETGCGKDLIASTIHRNSPRRTCPFVKVGCTLYPSQLIESELYGHEKGAFTGAEQRRQGRFELAEGGTLYLDDADDIPLEHQAKLLRAIEEKVYERVGGGTLIRADVRIIASTKRNLLEKIAAGSFRQDLYYRLDVMRVNIPPLRERREDVPLLANHLLKRIAKDAAVQLDPAAQEVLQRHDWPGNVRELCHVLERAYLVGSGRICKELLLAELEEVAHKRPPPTGPFHETIGKTERELLDGALQAAGGNKSAAAAALGMKLSTFRDKLVKHGLG